MLLGFILDGWPFWIICYILFIFLFLHPHQSFPFPPLFQVPLFIFSHPSSIVSFQKQAGTQWISATYGLPSCSETRHPLLYQGWIRKSSRKNRSQKLATESGAAPALTVRSSIKRLNCIALAYMRRAWFSPIQAPWLSLQARLVSFAGLLVVSLTLFDSTILPPPFHIFP